MKQEKLRHKKHDIAVESRCHVTRKFFQSIRSEYQGDTRFTKRVEGLRKMKEVEGPALLFSVATVYVDVGVSREGFKICKD